MDAIGQYAIAALTTGSIYALISMGVTMMYGVARVLNVANAVMSTLSALLTVEIASRGVPPLLAALVAITSVTVLGVLTYLVLFKRVLQRPFTALIISLGIVVVMEALLVTVWELDVYRLSGSLSESLRLGPLSTTRGSALTLAAGGLVTASLFVLLKRTNVGRAIRAVAEDAPTAALLGVDPKRVTLGMFAIGTAMAAIAGALIVTFIPISATSGSAYGIKTFGIAIVGGLGSPLGALIASMVLSTAETIPIALGFAQWSPAFLYLGMIAVLLVRPEGLFGLRGQHRGFGTVAVPQEAPASPTGAWSRASSKVMPILAVALAASWPWLVGADSGALSLSVYAVSLGLLAYSVWIPLHFIGVPSIAHGAVWGFAAYSALLAADAWGIGDPLPLFLVAVPVGMASAFVVGLIAMRVEGRVAAASITLALGGLGVNTLANMRSLTGGTMGASFVNPLSVLGVSFGFQDTNVVLFYVGLVLLVVAIAVLARFRRSSTGATLYAVRDSATLSSSLGISTYWTKVVAFGLSGVLAGVSGVLYVESNRYLEPSLFDDLVAINVLLAIIIGGSSSLYGPLIGTVLLVFVPDVLPFSGDLNRFWYGTIVVALATLAPDGITGFIAGLRGRRQRPAAAPPSSAGTAEQPTTAHVEDTQYRAVANR